jgi:hypothetical protein
MANPLRSRQVKKLGFIRDEIDMEQQLRELLLQFSLVHGVQGVLPVPINFQFQIGPHTRPLPLRDEMGVYLFFRGQDWLRIGQTSYSPRFTSQHYGTRRAGSSLARDVWANRQEFGFEGPEEQIDVWLFQNFGRANIRIAAHHGNAINRLLEAFLHLHLNPRFEGRR